MYEYFHMQRVAVHFVPQFARPLCLHLCHFQHFFISCLFCPFVFLLFSVPPFSLQFCLKLIVYADYDPYAMAGVCNDHGKTYALYAITVRRRSPNGDEVWKTYRRYSDFHDFHMRITEQVIVTVKKCVLPMLFINLLVIGELPWAYFERAHSK